MVVVSASSPRPPSVLSSCRYDTDLVVEAEFRKNRSMEVGYILDIGLLLAMKQSDLTVISPAPRELWSDIFNRDPSATAFQSPQWMDTITANGHYHDASRLYQTPQGRLVLPLVSAGPFRLPLSATSMAHGMGAGGLAAEFSLNVPVVRAIVDDLGRLPFLHLAIRPNALQATLWEAAVPATWRRVQRRTHILDLSGGYEKVWAERFHSAKRNRIRKAERAGLDIEQGTSPDFVRRFYDLYLLWSQNRARDRHLPQALIRWVAARREPMWKFRASARVMRGNLRIYLASHEGKAVAGTVYLHAGAAAIYWRGASDVRYLDNLPGNDLLQNEMIRHACSVGCKYYHMGESGGIASLARFKEGFGAIPHDYTEYVKERLPVTAVWSAAERALESAAAKLARR